MPSQAILLDHLRQPVPPVPSRAAVIGASVCQPESSDWTLPRWCPTNSHPTPRYNHRTERCRSWPNGLDSKSSEGASPPWVRIPPSPPVTRWARRVHRVTGEVGVWTKPPGFAHFCTSKNARGGEAAAPEGRGPGWPEFIPPSPPVTRWARRVHRVTGEVGVWTKPPGFAHFCTSKNARGGEAAAPEGRGPGWPEFIPPSPPVTRWARRVHRVTGEVGVWTKPPGFAHFCTSKNARGGEAAAPEGRGPGWPEFIPPSPPPIGGPLFQAK